jgi:C-terminal processing protease CtpA/Prc
MSLAPDATLARACRMEARNATSIARLPEGRLGVMRMAFRFLVLNRDRSVRLTTEGLGPRFHGRVVMLINEHTLSAGEMVAAVLAAAAVHRR